MLVIFVHGWSVRHTDTYGELPQWLEQRGKAGDLPIEVGNVYLGKYISFENDVTVDDIARAFDQAVKDEVGAKIKKGGRFACITHSTGGPVVRKWVDLHYRKDLSKCPMSHLIMLAPANHGSALAQLGKSRLSRLKFFKEGVEPGERVLDWLELGSEQGWELNRSWIEYDAPKKGLYPFVLTGQGIDRGLVDNLNSYTGEDGSDGVVRVAAANMNYGLLRLIQQGNKELTIEKDHRTQKSAFAVMPGLKNSHGLSHSGDEMGIIRSVKMSNARTHPTAKWILACLKVGSPTGYNKLVSRMRQLTAKAQKDQRIERTKRFFVIEREFEHDRYCMLVFRLIDDRGNVVNDYDLFLTAGPRYSPDDLPPGFFKDRQRNQKNPGKLTYYLNYDKMLKGLQRPELKKKIGIRIVARPEHSAGGLAFYERLEFKSSLSQLSKFLLPNQTLMIEVRLQRKVDKAVFQITNDLAPGPIEGTPLNECVQ